MERKTGVEPATFSLARRCSTTEPLPLTLGSAGGTTTEITGTWYCRVCRGPESNWRHQRFQRCALPTELPRRQSHLILRQIACQGNEAAIHAALGFVNVRASAGLRTRILLISSSLKPRARILGMMCPSM